MSAQPGWHWCKGDWRVCVVYAGGRLLNRALTGSLASCWGYPEDEDRLGALAYDGRHTGRRPSKMTDIRATGLREADVADCDRHAGEPLQRRSVEGLRGVDRDERHGQAPSQRAGKESFADAQCCRSAKVPRPSRCSYLP